MLNKTSTKQFVYRVAVAKIRRVFPGIYRSQQVRLMVDDQERYRAFTLEIQKLRLGVIRLKDRSQPFRKHLLDTIEARFDGFWRASQNHTDFSIRKIVVRKQ
jgi:hypothetical protein